MCVMREALEEFVYTYFATWKPLYESDMVNWN